MTLMRTFIFLLCATVFSLTPDNVVSQNSKIKIEKDITLTVDEVFDLIMNQTDYNFFYEEGIFKDFPTVHVKKGVVRTNKLLKQSLLKGDFEIIITNNYDILIKEKPINVVVEQQQINISGTVVDANGQPLAGASIIEKGTTNGAQTDFDGKFTINVKDSNAIVVVSYLGFQTNEIALNGQTNITVAMVEDAANLDEIVLIGYGTVKKSDLTGSVSTVKGDELNAFPNTNVMQALSGRSTGVQVSRNNGAPGAPVSVRIRGTNSIQGGNEPLYVVDGFPLSGSNPDIINNSDIESIEILKDASATAIYGSRGANGVVLITSKRGSSSGRTKIDLNTSYSSQSLIKKLDLMNATEYAMFINETRANDGLAPFFSQNEIDSFGEGFDWQDFAFQEAPLKTLSLNINGGNEKTQFSIGGSTLGQDGIVKGSNYNRYSLNTNITHKISEKLSVNVMNVLTRIETSGKNSGGSQRGASMISGIISAPPTLTAYNDDGSTRNLLTSYPFMSNGIRNPANYIYDRTDEIISNKILTNASFSYKPIPELTIKILGGLENSNSRGDTYVSNNFLNTPSAATVRTDQFNSFLSENTISYNKTFNEVHSVSAVAGYTYQDFIRTSLVGNGTGFLSDIPESYELQSAAVPGIPNSGYAKSVLESYLARVNYNFDNRYLVTFSARADGSSKYSPDSKWGYFPSAAFAWKVSNEDFLSDNTFISTLKLRTSWGKTGSQAINPYATLNRLFSSRTTFGQETFNTFAPGTQLPANLKWETTEQIDFGIDIGILNHRLSLTADYYVKNTTDLLNSVTLAPSSGYQTTLRNIGEIQNKGFEFGLNALVFENEFKWDVSLLLSFNRNEVVKLYEGIDVFGGEFNVNAISGVSNILREGEPVGLFWGFLEDGYDADGQVVFQDLDNDGIISENDRTAIGDPNPDFIYSFNSSMSYKNFDFSFFIQGVQGNNLLNISSINNTIDYGIGLNMPREVFLDHWTPTNLNAKYPKPSLATNARLSPRFVEDGSYLRLANIELAYNLKLNKDWIQQARFYVSGQNLLTLTAYSWWDPEVNSRGGANSVSQGIDHFSYPNSKAITFGVNLSF